MKTDDDRLPITAEEEEGSPLPELQVVEPEGKKAWPKSLFGRVTFYCRGHRRLVMVVGICVIAALIGFGMPFVHVEGQLSPLRRQDAQLVAKMTALTGKGTGVSWQDYADGISVVLDERTALVEKTSQIRSDMYRPLILKEVHLLQQENMNVQNEAISRFHSVLEPYWRKDNALLQDAIEIEIHPGSRTWNQAFTALDDNVTQREKLIDDVETLDPVIWQPSLSTYVSMLKQENDMVRSLAVTERGIFQVQVDLNTAQDYVEEYDDAEWDWEQDAAFEETQMMGRKLHADAQDLLADDQQLNADLGTLLATDKSFPTSTNAALFGTRNLQHLLQELLTDVKKNAKTMSKIT